MGARCAFGVCDARLACGAWRSSVLLSAIAVWFEKGCQGDCGMCDVRCGIRGVLKASCNLRSCGRTQLTCMMSPCNCVQCAMSNVHFVECGMWNGTPTLTAADSRLKVSSKLSMNSVISW
eukprot:896289-Rhodomonas_salina.2